MTDEARAIYCVKMLAGRFEKDHLIDRDKPIVSVVCQSNSHRDVVMWRDFDSDQTTGFCKTPVTHPDSIIQIYFGRHSL